MQSIVSYQVLNAAMLAGATNCPNLFITLTEVALQLRMYHGPLLPGEAGLHSEKLVDSMAKNPSPTCGVEEGMKLKNRHRWLLEVLKYIDSYVRDNQLWHMSYAVSEAFAAARTEIAFDYSDESNVIVFDPRCVKY
jgi:hypothetical protein